jgi:hypothetical protein
MGLRHMVRYLSYSILVGLAMGLRHMVRYLAASAL